MPDANSSTVVPTESEAKGFADVKDREAWFTSSPDPWVQIALLEFGGDRTFATTVHRMIVHGERDQQPVMEAKLMQALGHPNLTPAGRQFICRMLGLIGSSACIPAVAPLLQNDASVDSARMALDFVPDASINTLYRQALNTASVRAKGGLIGSIAARGDAQSIDALTAIAVDTSQSREIRAQAERAVEALAKRS